MPLNPNNRWFTHLSVLALLLGGLWAWTRAAAPGETSAGLIPAPQAGFLAPGFTLQTLTGEQLSLSDFRGRPVLINLWASWCGPCRAEMPAIQRVYDRYRQDGFTVLAVNMTAQDSEAAAAAFAAEYGLNFPILLDREGEVARLYENRALPSSFFVDEKGIIQEVVLGGPMAEALLRTRVEQLFAMEQR